MHSWVFRHRKRLRAIYGPRPELPGAGPMPISALLGDPAETMPSLLPAGDLGRVERLEGDEVLLHPMPRRLSA